MFDYFERRQNKTVIAAILCPAARISDVINKAGVCGERIKNVESQPFWWAGGRGPKSLLTPLHVPRVN